MKESLWLLALIAVLLLVSQVIEARAKDISRQASGNVASRAVSYHGVPISIDLPLNQEIRVHVDESVEIGLPTSLTSKLDVTSVHGIVYLTALHAFTAQRLVLKGVRTGRFVLLDVSATSDIEHAEHVSIRAEDTTSEPESPTSVTAVQLIRYVALATLAPTQPNALPAQIRRTALAIPRISIYRDFTVESTLLAAWRTDRLLALAVELRNESDEVATLNPLDIGGVWHAAAFQHSRLLPQEKRGSSTVMFLVGAHDAIADLGQ